MKTKPIACAAGLLMCCCLAIGADWPQFQCNAARTGWTSDSPAPPYEIAWSVTLDPELLGLVQPIVYQDVLYIPTLYGRLYALDPATGQRQWVIEGLGTIMRGAAAADGLVYVANVEGQVHAINPATKAIAWTSDLGNRGISATPCLDGGRIYIGCRNGQFVCLDGKTGSLVWQTKLDAYVWSSAAIADGRVYVGTDGELRLYCLNAADGKVIWRSDKLPGMFIRTWCPVLVKDKVYIRTMPAEYRFAVPKPFETWGPTHETFLKYHPDLLAGRFPEDFERGNDKVIATLTADPLLQTMFAFDVNTGKQPFVVAAFHDLAGWLSTPPPPAVDSQGMLQVPIPYGLSRFGRLNPDTGRVMDIVVGPLLAGERYGPKGQFARNPDGIGTNSDECHASVCGGDRVFWTHFGPGNCDTSLMFDVKTRQMQPLPGNEPAGKGWRWPKPTPISVSKIEPVKVPDEKAIQFSDLSESGGYPAAAIWKNMYIKNSTKGGRMIYAVRGVADAQGGGR